MRTLCRTARRRTGRCANNSDGAALIITLLILAIIMALVVEFAYGVYVSTNALYNWQSSQRLSYVAKSSVRFASWIITQSNQLSYTYPATMDIARQKPVESFNGNVEIRIENEEIKFNLNSLVLANGTVNQPAYDAFIRMLNALNLDPTLADWIVAWTSTAAGQNGAIFKQAPFDSVDEPAFGPGDDQGCIRHPFPLCYNIWKRRC